MHLDPILPTLVAAALAVIVIGLLLRLAKQPYVVAYLLAGVLLGPHGAGVFTNDQILSHLGAIGVLLLLFFVGMEVSLPSLVANWRIAALGTLVQVLVSVALVGAIGYRLEWSVARVVMLGFVISLSSTAVVFKVLQDWGELDTSVGKNVVGILLVQDVAIVPMLILLGFLGGGPVVMSEVIIQVIGGILIIALGAWLLSRGHIVLPLGKWLRDDHEIQVFFAMAVCFGFALLTGLAGLSTALGAFVAGILVASARETHWIHSRLDSFRVVFIALFFVSVGMLIDLSFIGEHLLLILLLVSVVLLLNTLINAFTLRALGEGWRESFYAGALLSQIGEFSFVLGATGYHSGIINEFAYQTTVAVIALALLISPLLILAIRRHVGHSGATA